MEIGSVTLSPAAIFPLNILLELYFHNLWTKSNFSGGCFSITMEMKPHGSRNTVIILIDLKWSYNNINKKWKNDISNHKP